MVYISCKTKQQTQKLLGLARPGAVKLAKQKQEGDIDLYKNLVNLYLSNCISW